MKTTLTTKKASLTTNLFKFLFIGALLFAACIDSALAASSVNRTLPPTYTPGSIVPVTVNVTPNPASYLYGVEEAPPTGWTISNVSHGGMVYTNISGSLIIKWGLFAGAGIFDNSSTPTLTPVPRTLTYSATPPPGTSGPKTFVGTLNDGISSIPIPNSTINLLIPDTTPPLISAVSAAGLTASAATINWTTNENSDSQIEYGLTTSYGSATTLNTAMLTAHSQGLSGLAASTFYNYRVKSKDAAGNLAISSNFTFTTLAAADTTPPMISAVSAAGLSASAATINWTTNENSDSQIEYGLTTSYGSATTLNTAMLTAHSQGLSGLAASTFYNYRVKSKDAAGNLAISSNFTFTTLAAADTTPPMISAVSAAGLSASAATINWTTNENSDSQIEYGLTTSYGSATTLNTAMLTAHSQGLSGLAASTFYNYRVKSKDAAGNLAISSNFTFTTLAAADTTPPMISAVSAAGLSASAATINWTTNENSDSQIEYGLTTSYGSATTLNTAMLTAHSQGLSGLAASTFYNYRVKSKDAAGNLAISSNFTFTTLAAADTTPPMISAVSAAGLSASAATINWTTNENSDSQIEYGLTTSYGSATTLNTAMLTAHSQGLSGLAASTFYNYRVKSKDAAGNLAISSNFTFTTLAAADTTPPMISAVSAAGLSASAATINWTTNENSDSQIEYGLTTSYGSATTLNTAMLTAHSQGLSGLAASTFYNYRVKSKDAAGNLAISSNFTFTTLAAADTTPPMISAVSAAGLSASAATINWTTNENSDSQIEYGLTTSYGSATTLNTAMLTAHSQGLSGLAASTFYNYRVKSKDAAGNLAISSNFTFTTLAAADTTPPMISAVSAAGLSASAATINWTTNENSDSQIEYGLTTSYGSATALNTAMLTAHSQGLSGLAASTFYNYRVKSKDAAGNLAISSNFTFTTLAAADTTPPMISAVSAAGLSASAATINWTTNENSDSQIEYGLTTSYGSVTALNTAMLTAHSQGLSGLAASTFYNYRVKSKDAAGNLAISSNFTFTTLAAGDTTPPTASITAPTSGASVNGTAVTVSANATDNVGVTGVQFKLDGVNLGLEDTTAPYSISWNSTLSWNGTHNLTAVARDPVGNLKTSIAVAVIVNNPDITPPVVSISAPAYGATVSGTVVTMSANAYDNVGVIGVQFKLDGANIGLEDTTYPYSISWNSTSVANGWYSLTAAARDAVGNLKTTVARSLYVSNGTVSSLGSVTNSSSLSNESGFDSFKNVLEPASGSGMTISYNVGGDEAIASSSADGGMGGETAAASSEVILTVYDRNGNTVKRLERASATSGSHSVTWDGKNEQGSPVVSGVYIVVMQRGNKSFEKKVVVAR